MVGGELGHDTRPSARARSLGVRLKSPGVCAASVSSWPCDSVSDLVFFTYE